MNNSSSFSKFKFTALALSLAGLIPSLALAQVTGSFSAAATVVQPLIIQSTTPLNFGSFASGLNSGSVIVSSTAPYTRTATEGVTLVNSGNVGSFSTITINGTAGTTYSVTLPPRVTLGASGGATMDITEFTTNLPTGSTKPRIPDSGTGSFQIGGTLRVAANQPGGSYAGTVPITIDYQ